jgi:hypothetical protein
MAKLKAIPKNFAEALAVMTGIGRYKNPTRLGNNTYLVSYTDGIQVDLIAVRLYNTEIVKFYRDGRVTLHTGGYRTVTTKERINHFITGRVFQVKHEWFYIPDRFGARAVIFVEGMII